MLAATAAALARSQLRTTVTSRIATAASTALEQASPALSGGERRFESSTSTSTAAASTSTSTSSSPTFSLPRSWSSTHSRSFSASSFASAGTNAGGETEKGSSSSSSSRATDGDGNAPSTSNSSTEDQTSSSWSNPMPSLEAIDDFLDEWGRLLDEGDSEGVLRLLEERMAAAPGLPPLEEVWASATAADDERAARRAHEAAAQLEASSRRLRLVDAQGRSYATGRRKEAVARVWLRPAGAGKGGGGEAASPSFGRVWVNGAPLDAAFPSAPATRAADVLAPFVVTRTVGDFDVRATVAGGGPTGQAQAVRHGIARALQLWAPEARPALKAAGLLTRDSRSVERKKPGRAKARKAFQWVKR